MFQESTIKNIDKFDSPELANKLFYSSVIGQEIMENFYESVARILAFFINFKQAKKSDPIEDVHLIVMCARIAYEILI